VTRIFFKKKKYCNYNSTSKTLNFIMYLLVLLVIVKKFIKNIFLKENIYIAIYVHLTNIISPSLIES